MSLPKTYRALVLRSTSSPLEVEKPSTPQPTPGVAVVRILVAPIVSYAREIYNGTRKYPFPKPLVVGNSAIGRIAAVGPDTASLTPGQLVHVDCMIRGRDDPTAIFLSGIHEGFSEGSRKLMHGEWRDSTFAEYAKVPLENCNVLDEKRLLGPVADGGLGYRVEELGYISTLLVPYGGLKSIDLKVGETIIVTPATGAFGGAAVLTAVAMGARVIAMGRNRAALERLKRTAAFGERIETVPITGDMQADTIALKKFGAIDAFFDISPPAAAGSTHMKSCILALTHGARVSLMGGFQGDVGIPHSVVMHKNMMLKGNWMYTRGDVMELVKMVERGMLKLGESNGQKIIGKFALEDWSSALNLAAENPGMGELTLFAP